MTIGTAIVIRAWHTGWCCCPNPNLMATTRSQQVHSVGFILDWLVVYWLCILVHTHTNEWFNSVHAGKLFVMPLYYCIQYTILTNSGNTTILHTIINQIFIHYCLIVYYALLFKSRYVSPCNIVVVLLGVRISGQLSKGSF